MVGLAVINLSFQRRPRGPTSVSERRDCNGCAGRRIREIRTGGFDFRMGNCEHQRGKNLAATGRKGGGRSGCLWRHDRVSPPRRRRAAFARGTVHAETTRVIVPKRFRDRMLHTSERPSRSAKRQIFEACFILLRVIYSLPTVELWGACS